MGVRCGAVRINGWKLKSPGVYDPPGRGGAGNEVAYLLSSKLIKLSIVNATSDRTCLPSWVYNLPGSYRQLFSFLTPCGFYPLFDVIKRFIFFRVIRPYSL